MKHIDADLLRKEIEKKRKNIEGLFMEGDDSFYDGQDDAYNNVLTLIDSLPHEQHGTPVIEVTARCVYESWMGGTMNDVRRHMNELGRVLNARKEESK